MVGQMLFIFGIQEFNHLSKCLVNLNISAPEVGALQIAPKSQNGDFLKNSSNDFD
jgi:hypothetical protein